MKNKGRSVTTPEQDDDGLLRAYTRGDQSAFVRLYDCYKQPIFRYLLRNCRDRQRAEELFQEVWLRVIAGATRFESRGKFRPWLFSVAHNCIIDLYRKEGRATLESFEGDMPDETMVGATGVDSDRIEGALRQLPLDQRQAFYLREVLGCSVAEIAGIQGVTVEAAKSRLRYACQKLREVLGGEA